MGYQRDMRIERQARARLAGCEACKAIDQSGVSYLTHTCGRKILTAREAGLHGSDFEKLP
jgi:hypothetical protein